MPKVAIRLIDCPLRVIVFTATRKRDGWPLDKLECGHYVARKQYLSEEGEWVPIPAKRHRCRECGIASLAK
jgi:hypothetical protein